MSTYTHTREAVRVKVKKCEPNTQIEWRKFSVDPQITTLDVLYSLLAKAFDIKSDFSIKYKAFDPAGNELYLAVLSDWDLDAAFLRIHNIAVQTASEACLILQIDVKPFTEMKDFEAETPTSALNAGIGKTTSTAVIGAREIITPLQQSFGASQKYVQHMQNRLPGLIMNQMEKTFSIVQKAFNLNEETMASLPPRMPVSDNEFRDFLDALGQIQRNDDLRKAIFLGGIDPSLRRVVWKHLLNVYPSGMNGHQRMDYMRRKAEHYHKLRDTWKSAIKQGCVNSELAYVTSMVKKDVLRTDRLHSFYAGSDDNQNIASLFNILTTYALNHPTVSYCQGMSDIASPLLVTMNDEAQAYICFCAIMERMRGNFMLDGMAMTQKFAHLTEALSYYDPEFWDYLKLQQADDLLFCYRWLLLELKREFPFEDALRMLEVQWSSIKYTNCKELCLFEKEFDPTPEPLPVSTKPPTTSSSYLLAKPRESAYTKVCALRRQSSSASLSSLSSSYGTSSSALSNTKLDTTKHLNQSLDENIARHVVKRRHRRSSAKAHQSLDESKMLMLIEGIESLESIEKSSESKSNDLTSSDITDDEVFPINSPALETQEFDFHPTNPFKNDAKDDIELCDNVQSFNSEVVIKLDKLNAQQKTTSTTPTQIPKSIANLQNKNVLSNYNAVSNIIAKQLGNASNAGESVKRIAGSSGGHFKDLKEKIAATSKKGMSFDEPNNDKSQQKLVKNFNEFLNFAAKNKNKISDKFVTAAAAGSQLYEPQRTKTPTPSPTHPLVQLTRSGYNSSFESDTSSVMDTTWSNSTAPTALQQGQTLSNHSLQLELNSLPYTPDRTPTLEHKEPQKLFQPNTKSDSPDEQDYYPMSTTITRELRIDAENLDRQIFRDDTATVCKDFDIEYVELDKDSLDLADIDLKENEILTYADVSELLKRKRSLEDKLKQQTITQDKNINANPFIDEVMLIPPSLHLSTSLPEVLIALDTTITDDSTTPVDEMAINAADEIVFDKSTQLSATNTNKSTITTSNMNSNSNSSNTTNILNNEDNLPLIPAPALPSPTEFGGGNPFLMFLCLTLLLQHRNTIIKSAMDYNEIAMHFDKMVRKHDVTRVLNQARRMYIDYLKVQNAYKQQLQQQAQKNQQNQEQHAYRDHQLHTEQVNTGNAIANHNYKNRSSFKSTRTLQPMSS